MKQRYDRRKDDDDTWTVFDVSTGLPVILDGATMVGLTPEEADYLVCQLNLQDATRWKSGR